MSGVECAGLALAVLPHVIEAAKSYKNGVDSIRDVLSISRRDSELEDFYRELWEALEEHFKSEADFQAFRGIVKQITRLLAQLVKVDSTHVDRKQMVSGLRTRDSYVCRCPWRRTYHSADSVSNAHWPSSTAAPSVKAGLWLGTRWGKRQISFFYAAADTIDNQRPYIATSFDGNDQAVADFSLFHHNGSMLALGILLIEIHTGKPIETYRTPKDLSNGTEVNANTDWTVADRVVKSLDDCSLG
ncbi:MAG: hypothetical protein Q9184_006418 [Pyrenodesmia sp. 2 TL-2023]